MRVITVNDEEFDKMCRDLHRKILQSEYYFDVLIGIARAGVYVAERFETEKFYVVRSQRKSTSVKRGVINAVLRKMPAFMNCFLRVVESRILEWKDYLNMAGPEELVLDDSLKACLKEGGHKVMIVDDAADSGRSLLNAVEAVRGISGNNVIRTAVITVTRKKTLISPDYALFRNSTLLRFPWSADICNTSKESENGDRRS